ncbi:imidazole glycerol phosphate synthase subunit HisH [Dehalogenimonas etheniformans]|uniref:Imidazole glycerol phosphate synthase subunit HisH n=1 Tax=Dehalogenimonas etheniformans TaxID=1536648 RepID=A0A2P5P927_9CHLR|nr:imidazole glycerol phosphate synthase subunit HisH [Dehalogenimonas etheniformans]PPD58799.1 imidazole glycerol phosphate synthase subunit HisH [Dehalogenimonas etheniformans]QNT76431.1 imidazole glycerol phosphate synthase subunit HisH [Dehalogenimonas etheniformans]
MIAIIDYGAGNLRSVANAIALLGYDGRITSSPEEVVKADAVFLPGVGAAADTVSSLQAQGLDKALREIIARNTPLFAVCVGLQVLFEETEEGGGCQCLGLLPGKVRKLPAGIKVPHIGWNNVKNAKSHALFSGIEDNSFFYFVHSYYVEPDLRTEVIGTTEYGINFASAIARGNLVATQFHPEKSGAVGLKMYDNFLKSAIRGTDENEVPDYR